MVKLTKPFVRAAGFEKTLNYLRMMQIFQVLNQTWLKLSVHIFREVRRIFNLVVFKTNNTKMGMGKSWKSLGPHLTYHLMDTIVYFTFKLIFKIVTFSDMEMSKFKKMMKIRTFAKVKLTLVKYLFFVKEEMTVDRILMRVKPIAESYKFYGYPNNTTFNLNIILDYYVHKNDFWVELNTYHPWVLEVLINNALADGTKFNYFYIKVKDLLNRLTTLMHPQQELKDFLNNEDYETSGGVYVNMLTQFKLKYNLMNRAGFLVKHNLFYVLKGGLDYVSTSSLKEMNMNKHDVFVSNSGYTNKWGSLTDEWFRKNKVVSKLKEPRYKNLSKVQGNIYALNEPTFLIGLNESSKLLKVGEVNYSSNPVQQNVNNDALIIEEFENSKSNYDTKLIMPDQESIDLWSATDITFINQMLINKKSKKYQVKEGKMELRKLIIGMINRYPRLVRPYLDRMIHGHFNAIGLRFNEQTSFCKHQLVEVNRMVNKIWDSVSDKNLDTLIKNYHESKVTFNISATLEWLKKSPYEVKIIKELTDYLDRDITLRPLNETKIIMKIEGILKEDPWNNIASQKNRIVMWQYYCIAALMSPIINELKKRFKSTLGDKFLYADGSTPEEISHWLQSLGPVEEPYFVEVDFSKQDVNTHENTLKCELKFYELLGMHPLILKWWATVHNKWRFNSGTVSGYEVGKRQTGSVTTAFGNLLNNVINNHRLFVKYKKNLIAVLMVGDDGDFIFDSPINKKEHVNYCKVYWNQLVKIFINNNGSKFAGGIVYWNHKGLLCYAPDYVRMNFKIEVTNGVSELTTENIKSRCTSYCFQVGDNSDTRKLIKKLYPDHEIKLPNWHNHYDTLLAISKTYDIPLEMSENYYDELLTSMNKDVIKVEFLISSSKKL